MHLRYTLNPKGYMHQTAIDGRNRWLRVINRCMFGLSLIGILDTIHLFVQNQYGFNKGCLGFVDTAIEQSFNCQQVVNSSASTLFGVSNTIIGLAFFILFSLFLLFRISKHSSWHALLNRFGGLILLPALVFSGYLFYYQHSILEEYCLLCLVSATLITLLAILEMGRGMLIKYDKTDKKINDSVSNNQKEIRFRLLILIIVALISSADLLIASSQHQKQESVSSKSAQTFQADSLVLKNVSHSAIPSKNTVNCRYVNAADSQKYNLISFYDPVEGADQPRSSIIVYFDPLRQETYEMYEISRQLIDKWGHYIEIVYKPVASSRSALFAVKALYAANKEEKFTSFMQELMNVVKDRHQQNGDAIDKISSTIGVNKENFKQNLSSVEVKNHIYMEKAKANAAGIDTLPAIFINGKQVADSSRTLDCLETLLENSL